MGAELVKNPMSPPRERNPRALPRGVGGATAAGATARAVARGVERSSRAALSVGELAVGVAIALPALVRLADALRVEAGRAVVDRLGAAVRTARARVALRSFREAEEAGGERGGGVVGQT